jgi:hypothetical protein
MGTQYALQDGYDSSPYGFDPTFQRFSSVYNGKVMLPMSTHTLYSSIKGM